jgi:hypothetical protein
MKRRREVHIDLEDGAAIRVSPAPKQGTMVLSIDGTWPLLGVTTTLSPKQVEALIQALRGQ